MPALRLSASGLSGGAIMWLPGHLAVSFLLCLPLLMHVKRERLLALYFVGVFALLPDFLHLGPMRIVSHSLLGVTVMSLGLLAVLFLLFRPRPALLAVGAVAAYGHLLADLYIGSIYPFYPVSETWYQLHQFNTAFDIAAEIVLASAALVIGATLFGLPRLFRSRLALDRSERGNLLLLLLPFGVMVALQGAYFAYLAVLMPFDPLRPVLLLFFLVPAVFSAAVLLRTPLSRGL